MILTLLAFKCLYPHSLHLTRGNHEAKSMNTIYGFVGEVKHKYNVQVGPAASMCRRRGVAGQGRLGGQRGVGGGRWWLAAEQPLLPCGSRRGSHCCYARTLALRGRAPRPAPTIALRPWPPASCPTCSARPSAGCPWAT